MAALRLWKFDKITGLWRVARGVTEESAAEWLKIYQRDEPKEIFVVSIRKPPTPKQFCTR